MKRSVVVAPTAEVRENPSIYGLLKIKLRELSEELEQKSLEIQKLTDKPINTVSNNRYSKQ